MTPFFSENGGPASVQAIIAGANTSGTHGARPAATGENSGNLYFETDTLDLFMSRASSWLKIASFSSNSSGTHSARPAASEGNIGKMYFETDTDTLFMSVGTSWVEVANIATPAPPAIPTGSIMDFGGAAAPDGWMICDGSAISRTTYAALFGVLGTIFGNGDSTTTFNLPDLRGRVSIGTADVYHDLADYGGQESVTLDPSQMPTHNHGGITEAATPDPMVNNFATDALILPGQFGADFNVLGGTTGGVHYHSIDSDGGGAPHENMMPFLTVNKIIKL